MTGDLTFHTLLSGGVLTETDDGGVDLSPGFREAVAEGRRIAKTDSETRRAAVVERVSDEDAADSLLAVCEDDGLLARTLALLDRTDLDVADALHLSATAIDRLERPSEPSEGVPNAFVPVHGDRLPTLLELHDRAVVYVWRLDCPPCDLVRETLDEQFPEHPDDVTLLAVYGPDSAAFLQDRYDVVAGPTTLFVVDGTVDARLQGAFDGLVFENEIDVLRE